MATEGASVEGKVVLEFTDLHKEFRLGVRLKRVHAVRGVSLQVGQGEIFGYLGPNGAGKTTTMKMAMGLIQPTSGSIQIFGKDVEEVSNRARIGYLPEHPYFYDYLSAVEIVSFYGRLCGIPRRVLRKRVDELLELVGLSHAKKRRLRGFSKGMLQRVGIAQALVNDPSLIVLDEPLSGLDPIGRKEVRDIIVQLRASGKTVFFSSHILQDIEMICDRVAIINHGRIERIGSLEAMLRQGQNEVNVVLKRVSDRLRDALNEEAGTITEIPDGLSLRVHEERLGAILQLLISESARIVQVSPQRDSLEELFVREAGGSNATG